MGFAIFVGCYLAAANGLAFWAFARDKRAAISGARRISEDRLLAIAFLGGSVGAKLAQRLLRHKIRTEPFRTHLNGIIAIQALTLAVIWALWLMLR